MSANAISDSVNQVFARGGQGSAEKATTAELRNNFMTLLVTQLQNQDPLKPLENSELTSQLAQINTVSGIDSLNETMQGITTQIEAGQSLQAAELIGKGVLVPGNRMLVGEGGVSTPFGVELSAPAKEMKAHIIGGDGEILRTLELGALPSGVRTVYWDGELESGEVAPQGAYSVVLEGLNEDGEALEPVTLNYAVVNGVSNGGNEGVRLDLGGVAEQIGLSDVRQIL